MADERILNRHSMCEGFVSGKWNIDIMNDNTETRNKKDLHFRLEWGEEIQN